VILAFAVAAVTAVKENQPGLFRRAQRPELAWRARRVRHDQLRPRPPRYLHHPAAVEAMESAVGDPVHEGGGRFNTCHLAFPCL
jgi:hypothetical protein